MVQGPVNNSWKLKTRQLLRGGHASADVSPMRVFVMLWISTNIAQATITSLINSKPRRCVALWEASGFITLDIDWFSDQLYVYFFSVYDELISMEPHWQHIMWRTSAQIDEFTHHISLKRSQWSVLHPPKFSALTLHICRNAPLDTSRFLKEKAA